MDTLQIFFNYLYMLIEIAKLKALAKNRKPKKWHLWLSRGGNVGRAGSQPFLIVDLTTLHVCIHVCALT